MPSRVKRSAEEAERSEWEEESFHVREVDAPYPTCPLIWVNITWAIKQEEEEEEKLGGTQVRTGKVRWEGEKEEGKVAKEPEKNNRTG